jgi:DNA polymerase III epsilon subunit-like protein
MYKSHLPMLGLCIDWETSGSDWGGDSSKSYQGVSYGAVIFNTRTFEEVDSEYCEIEFDDSKYKWTDGAEKIHGLSREHLSKQTSREDAAIKLASFILKYFGAEPIVMLSHNTRFDEAFTRQLLEDFEIPFRTHPCQLDTSGTAFICLGINNSNAVFDFFGLDKRGAHNALDDARMSLQVAKQFHLIFKELFA